MLVANRFYDVARKVTGYELYPPGQEPVNWLFYKPGYEYRPHCDGNCRANGIRYGDRVCTSLLYCTVAEEGGGTVFTVDELKFLPTPGVLPAFHVQPRQSWSQ